MNGDMDNDGELEMMMVRIAMGVADTGGSDSASKDSHDGHSEMVSET